MAEFTKQVRASTVISPQKAEAMDSSTLSPSCDVFGLDQIGTQKISVLSDQTNSFNHNSEKPDSFVLDIESFSHAIDRDITSNSRFTLQRNLSRKCSSQRGVEKKNSSNEKDTVITTCSPKAVPIGAGTPGSPMGAVVGTTEHLNNLTQTHHQISITSNNISSTHENKAVFRRNSFKRSPSSWSIDSRKIMFFFATLSSMGTILLIYFTLSISKANDGVDDTLNWPQ